MMATSRTLYVLLFALLFATGPYDSSYAADPDSEPVQHPPFAQKVDIPGISDAGKLNDYLYRGTQPDEKGLKNLRKLGIDMIVDLRGEFPWKVKKESEHAKKLGMHLIRIPGNGWADPKDKQVAQFFALIQEQPRHKIYVHCWLGGDRAGVFLAAYRIAFDGWTPEQALDEMHQYHFHGFWHRNMSAYVKKFPERLNKSEVLAPYRHAESTHRVSTSRASEAVARSPAPQETRDE
jgi:tyrosine-protein phosphatase SIW14